MWYGEFIHGVLEGAFGMWRENPARFPFPWPCTPIPDAGAPSAPPGNLAPNDLRVIGWPIEEALAHEGKRARSRRARVSAYRRAEAAVNMLGPHLFPLIADAEQKVIGTRPLPPMAPGMALRSERYALHGVIDVLTNVELANVGEGNIIRDAVREACPDLQGTFEVIVDYKGSHRPPVDTDYWQLGEWQVQTYAWLRQRQQLGYPVAAGILIYANELAPSSDDMRRMRGAMQRGQTDVIPTRGDPDYYALNAWTAGAAPRLTQAFRYRRAIRVIPITEQSIDNATGQFDRIVAEIETRVREEELRGSIRNTWPPTPDSAETCVACDFRFFCPRPAASPAEIAAATAAGDDDDV
jgi:CRISPR/Cas system-associated exonuclease Cas4 (RecB family)